MATSGTYAFNPALSDIVIEAFERCGIRASEITPDHMFSARRSINLIQAMWTNKGVNLFAVDQLAVPLVQGIATYSVPTDTIMVLDTFIRTYSMNVAEDLTPAFATTSSSTSVIVTQASPGVAVGNFINVVIPVSIGGIIIYGFYEVDSVIDINNYTITAAVAAASTTSGGVVPLFTTTTSSTSVSVTLPVHGYLSGQSFIIQIPVTVGGITLSGSYTISSITSSNVFVIAATSPATSSESVYENNGECQIATQNSTAQPIDRVMGPMSRTDYNSLPNKSQQGFPTIFWYDRLIDPTLTLWQVPDGNGPYQMFYYRVRQIQDSNPVSGQVAEIPYRFLEALCAGTAFHLSMKWAIDRSIALKAYYDEVFNVVIEEDREIVPMRFAPDFSPYYQG